MRRRFTLIRQRSFRGVAFDADERCGVAFDAEGFGADFKAEAAAQLVGNSHATVQVIGACVKDVGGGQDVSQGRANQIVGEAEHTIGRAGGDRTCDECRAVHLIAVLEAKEVVGAVEVSVLNVTAIGAGVIEAEAGAMPAFGAIDTDTAFVAWLTADTRDETGFIGGNREESVVVNGLDRGVHAQLGFLADAGSIGVNTAAAAAEDRGSFIFLGSHDHARRSRHQ